MIEFWDIALLLLGAKLGGSIFSRIQQPSIIGELIAGIILGSVLGIVVNSTTIQIISQLGAMFLILLTTLSIDFSKIDNNIEKLVVIQIVSAAIIFLILLGISMFMGMNLNLSLVVAVAIFGSSTTIAARTLMAMDAINSSEGQTIIGLQIVNGIIELLLILAVINMLQEHTFNIEPLIKLVLMIIGTFVVMSRVGYRFINRIFNYAQKFKMEEVLLAFTLVLAFTAAALAEKAGVTSFLGVMLVGMLISKTPQALIITQKVKELGESFFIPIFFASIGLGVSMIGLAGNLEFLTILMVAIIVIRLAAFIIPIRLMGCSGVESLKIGSGLLSMSEYGLLIMSIGIAYKVLDVTFYSVFVIIFLLINIFSPFVVKMVFKIKSTGYKRTWRRRRRSRFLI